MTDSPWREGRRGNNLCYALIRRPCSSRKRDVGKAATKLLLDDKFVNSDAWLPRKARRSKEESARINAIMWLMNLTRELR